MEAGSALVKQARALAERAHAGQVDKAGRPYIEHVCRVAGRVQAAGGSDDAIAVAWLHDVQEDCPAFAHALAHFPGAVTEAVDLLTRRPHIHPDAYYASIRLNPVALTVKLADVADNADPARLASLAPQLRQRLERKYAHAAAALANRPVN